MCRTYFTRLLGYKSKNYLTTRVNNFKDGNIEPLDGRGKNFSNILSIDTREKLIDFINVYVENTCMEDPATDVLYMPPSFNLL